MADWSDVLATTRAMVDPSTSAEDLASIAQAQKGLWVQIAGHPNVYPALLDWLSSQGDEAVRAAVASRQQQTQLSVPVPPPPPATKLPATNSAPKRMKKAWLISGAGVLVVVVALLIILVVHSSASVLRYDQLQTLVSYLGGGDDMVEDAEDLQDFQSEFEGCPGLAGRSQEIIGMTRMFDGSNREYVDDATAVVFDTHNNAVSLMDPFIACMSQGDDALKVVSRDVSDVSMSIWSTTYEENDEVRVAIYKNVGLFLFTDPSVSTREEWQTYMTTTFKSAVDQAIKS